jgi:hypothetical protein
MLVRFDCPACKGSHSFDMPETIIHMTCGRTHQAMMLKLTKGGDVRATIVNGDGAAAAAGGDDEKE